MEVVDINGHIRISLIFQVNFFTQFNNFSPVHKPMLLPLAKTVSTRMDMRISLRTLHINDLGDPNECGGWVAKIMQIILAIPKDEIVGPRPGRVSMSLQAGSEQKNFNFYIDRYQALATDLSNTEICAALQTQS